MKDYQKGQILLIIVLIMVTVLTVGLSVAVRSINNIRTSQDDSNSEKAFSAAESGIEQSLTSNSALSGSFSNNSSSFKTNIVTVAGTGVPLNNNVPVLKDNATELFLSTYPSYTNQWNGKNVTIYWGQASDTCDPSEAKNTMAALEILVLSGTTANPQETRYTEDPCYNRSLDNKFEYVGGGGGTVAGQVYRFGKTIPINNAFFVHIVPLYAPTVVAATGCNAINANCTNLPTQGTQIESVGTSGETQRKIVAYRYFPIVPDEVFQYTLFSPQ